MIVGKIVGRLSTVEFEFLVSGYVRKFDYVQVMHRDHNFVLCQVVEIRRDADKTFAKSTIVGFKDDDGRVRQIRTPFYAGAEVLMAEDDFIKEVVNLDGSGAYIGLLEGKDIPVFIDINKLLTKHVAVLAKSGSGKSYAVGVLLEEIIERKVPLLIIDPHGEYASMKLPNTSDKDALAKFNVSAKGFSDSVAEFFPGPTSENDMRPLLLSDNLSADDLLHLLPSKLSSAQQGILYSALKSLNRFSFDDLISEINKYDSGIKWGVINLVDYLKNLGLFSSSGTDFAELVKPGRCSILNLRGVDPFKQEVVVYKLLKDLFNLRKLGKIPPFFVVVEEAHNFCPERGFGEKKSSKVLRDLASEGRKFGLGLCIISQRPARVDKSVLSQCTTQIILKVTNPSDLKAIASSVEGITSETENEIKNLPVGCALLTGVVDMPLFVQIRPRMSSHGGRSVDILEEEDEKDVLSEVENFDLLPVISPRWTPKDFRIMYDDVESVKTFLLPCALLTCKKGGQVFDLLFELSKGFFVEDVDRKKFFSLPNLKSLSFNELRFVNSVLYKESFVLYDLNLDLPDFKVEELSSSLIDKGLLDLKNNMYSLKKKVKLMFNPGPFAFLGKVDYKKVEYEKQLEGNVSVDEIKKVLYDYVEVVDSKECFMIYYDVVRGIKK